MAGYTVLRTLPPGDGCWPRRVPEVAVLYEDADVRSRTRSRVCDEVVDLDVSKQSVEVLGEAELELGAGVVLPVGRVSVSGVV